MNQAIISIKSGNRPMWIELWDLSECEMIQNISFPSAGHVFPVAVPLLMHNYSDMMFNSAGDLLVVNNGMDVFVWDIVSLELAFSVEGDPICSPVDIFTFNADDSLLVTGKFKYCTNLETYWEDYSVSIWDADTGSLLREIDPSSEYLHNIVPTLDEDIMLVSDSDGFTLWDITTGEQLSFLESGDFVFDALRGGIWIG